MPSLPLGRFQRIAAFFGRRAGKSALHSKSDDWAAGDLAECIGGGQWFNGYLQPTQGPAHGDTFRVAAIWLSPHPLTGHHMLWLSFSAYGTQRFDARLFRKITPRADAASAADSSFIDKLKRGRVPAPALFDQLAARLERILS